MDGIAGIVQFRMKAIPGTPVSNAFKKKKYFETSKKKLVHFYTNGLSVSVLLGIECITIPKWQSTKRKWGCDDEPIILSTNYDTAAVLDPGL